MGKVLFVLTLLLLILGGKEIVAKAAIYDGKTLDTGIYWFGSNGENEKYVEGQKNKFFDNNKPTVIYVHGWQPNTTKALKRECFKIKNSSKVSADYWVEKGWNIGVFYWNQFADEGEVKDAEAKIWTKETSKALRWRKVDEKYVYYEGKELSVTDIFINQYLECMKNFAGSEIRLVGHSLGNQLVINSSKVLDEKITNNEIRNKLRPTRVALLDPFWSKFAKSYLNGKWTGEVCREYVSYLKTKGIVFEQYKSSNINDFFIGDSNEAMKKLTVFTDFYPDYISLVDQSSKHTAITSWYFQSFGYEAPNEFLGDIVTGRKACSASTLIMRLKEMMGSGYYWYQKGGKNTATPLDDTFQLAMW